jgi:competence protein ComEC
MFKRPLCLVACFGLAVVLIMMLRSSYTEEQETPPLEHFISPREAVIVIGKIYNQEIRNQHHVIHLTNLRLSDDNIIPDSRIIVYANIENVPLVSLEIGDIVMVSGTVNFFDERRNPGNFDQKSHFHKQGIHGSMFVEQVEFFSGCENIFNQLRTHLIRVKYSWIDVLFANLGEEHGGLLASILLGEKRAIDQDIKRMFQKNGIGHILVISGLHMSFLGVGLYTILRRCGLSFAVAGLIGLLFLIIYTLMIGVGVSSFRALIMFAIRIGAEIAGRKYDGANSLAIALIAFLLWRPNYITDPGFLLSFGAVLSIVMVMPVLTTYFVNKKESRLRKNIKKAFILNLSINLIIIPIVSTFFFEFPLYTIFINVLVVPLMAFLLGAGLLASFLYVIVPILGQGVFFVCRTILWFYEGLCELFLNLPGSRVITGQPQIWQVILYYCLFFVLYLYIRNSCIYKNLKSHTVVMRLLERIGRRGKYATKTCFRFQDSSLIKGFCNRAKRITVSGFKLQDSSLLKRFYYRAKRITVSDFKLQDSPLPERFEYKTKVTTEENAKFKLIIPFTLLCFMLLSLFPLQQLNKELTITMIDVGQGDGIFIRDPHGGTYLIDGGSSNVSGVGIYRMEPFLLSQGIRKIDIVFLSHGDEDHFSGIIEMMENQRLGIIIDTLVLPGIKPHNENVLDEIAKVAKENNIQVATIDKEQGIIAGDLEIRCLAPPSNLIGRDRNDYSMVLSLTYRNFSMLFTGDIEDAGERALIINEDLSHHTILKVAHHGSRTSSSQSFLEQVSPKIALISAGQNNRFNHPSSEVVKRIESFGSEIYVTNEVGAITVKTNGDTVRIKSYITVEDEPH